MKIEVIYHPPGSGANGGGPLDQGATVGLKITDEARAFQWGAYLPLDPWHTMPDLLRAVAKIAAGIADDPNDYLLTNGIGRELFDHSGV